MKKQLNTSWKWTIWSLALFTCANLTTYCCAATTSVAGDVNGDGVIDFSDASVLSTNYGLTSGATLAQGDLNRDGAVNFSDSFELIANYTSSFATTPGTVGDGITSFSYNAATGSMLIETTSANLNGVNLTSSSNLFIPNVANWIGQDYSFFSNTTSQQGFSTLTAFGDTFFVNNGYVIGAILPAGLTQAGLLADLTLSYSVQGVAGTQTGDLIYIGSAAASNDTVITATPSTVDFGRRMLGTTPSDSVTLNKTGTESTTYSATSNNDGISVTSTGTFAGGVQSENIGVQLQNNANGSATTGLKNFTVTANNLATTSAAAGQGSADPDDIANVSATVVDNRVVNASGVNLGNVIVGVTTAPVNSSLTTTGDDDNFTRVTVSGGTSNGGASVAAGSQLFNDAGDVLALAVTGNFSNAGATLGNVSLNVTGEGLAGESPIAVSVAFSANVFDASDAQFNSNGGNSLTLDFGNKIQNTGSYNLAEAILNALNTAGFTAELDFDSILSASGDTGVLFTDLANNAFAGLTAGNTYSFAATFDSNNAVGSYSATYQFGLSDSDSYQGAGAVNSQILVLILQGKVVPVPEPCGGLLLALGAVWLGSLRRRLR